MSSSPPIITAARLFHHPSYWCHFCDTSISLPPSPSPAILLCPNCRRDSLEQMELEDSLSPQNSRSMDPTPAATPTSEDTVISGHYLHRLIDSVTTTSTANAAPRSAIDSLQEITITSDSDPDMLCPVCKDPFLLNSTEKMMPCKHTYHSDCIIPWLKINNSCPVCRFKLPAGEEGKAESGVRFARLQDWFGVDEELGDFGTLGYISRRRQRSDGGRIGGASHGSLLSPLQIWEVERGNRDDDAFAMV
ncbi:E3 ubiquitin-protein ligase SDIR1-like [Sesamum indicum]|uniref:RING-type E3 ubiquitin transferase n=1 Tax=Sesamum indicum TaxID=4182 RepID=A0A6I9U0D4_SESIN|nr:E3 ubiquitin-protein ligase SDIR1-like [Sesamum indicum]